MPYVCILNRAQRADRRQRIIEQARAGADPRALATQHGVTRFYVLQLMRQSGIALGRVLSRQTSSRRLLIEAALRGGAHPADVAKWARCSEAYVYRLHKKLRETRGAD